MQCRLGGGATVAAIPRSASAGDGLNNRVEVLRAPAQHAIPLIKHLAEGIVDVMHVQTPAGDTDLPQVRITDVISVKDPE